MATLEYKIINPIRIYNPANSIDYNNIWPFIDKQRLESVYHKGTYNEQTYDVDWRTGKKISIQVIINDSLTGTVKADFNDENGDSGGSVTITNTTPSGYPSGSYIKTISVTPSASGLYRFIIYNSASGDDRISFHYSDWISVSDNSDKSLVEFQYRDSDNRYGGYFWKTSSNNVWFPKAYYTGFMLPAQPESDEEDYTDEDGSEYTLDATLQRVQTLTLNDIHMAYVDIIKYQSVCSDFYVNGLLWKASDFNYERIGNTYLCNITMKLKLKGNKNNLDI